MRQDAKASISFVKNRLRDNFCHRTGATGPVLLARQWGTAVGQLREPWIIHEPRGSGETAPGYAARDFNWNNLSKGVRIVYKHPAQGGRIYLKRQQRRRLCSCGCVVRHNFYFPTVFAAITLRNHSHNVHLRMESPLKHETKHTKDIKGRRQMHFNFLRYTQYQDVKWTTFCHATTPAVCVCVF